MKKELVFSLLFLFSFVVLNGFASSQLFDCRIHERDAIYNASYGALYNNLNASYQKLGYVSMQGHFASELIPGRVLYPYGLFCDNRLNRSRVDVGPSFKFSNPSQILYIDPVLGPIYGSGRVSFNNNPDIVNFTGNANFGFRDGDCRVVHSSDPNFNDCGGGVCVVRTSNPDQGFIADCNNDTMPYPNNFQYKICCTPREICNDGIDNTGDGLIDCASPDCHPNLALGVAPQQCAPGPFPGNNQSTLECISGTDFDVNGNAVTTYHSHCTYTEPGPFGVEEYFYCNYGFFDNSSIEPEGYCCPVGQWYNKDVGECQDFVKCGIDSSLRCGYSFFNDPSLWLNQVFSGAFNWCHSHLPLFTNLGSNSVLRSEACCPVIHQ